ncbi:hypothetical protein RGQ29_004573 [Quercus rubra]|uniref:Uncharacterized protein n=1 Tax=Quercus rubra TaxID=3512 RepID=A0AAN7IGK2_QUERU|nr:hypothetical protein RGQ29_004573 [Quercus rubra]
MVSLDPNAEKAVVPKEEILDFELPPKPSNARHVELYYRPFVEQDFSVL